MSPLRRRAAAPRAVTRLLLAMTCLFAACGDDGGGGTGASGAPPARIAVLSAFPGELAAVLARMRVEQTVEVAGRTVRVGTLGGTPVVAAMTGIGLVNAANTSRAVLAQFPIRGVVVSGVAGSSLNIADVAAVASWSLSDGSTYVVDRRWLRIAKELAEARSVRFESCALVPSASPDPVCLPNPPVLVVGGEGESEDPFGGAAFPCHAGSGDIYGCDAEERAVTAAAAGTGADGETPLIQDMESAAIAREAAAQGVPFIAFRAVSDGAGDPLGLPGFPAQFYAYYHLAANNAAAAAEAFLAQL
jgi:nucleoside phosphorylase